MDFFGLRYFGCVCLIVMTVMWTASPLSRSTYYQQISINQAANMSLILLAPPTVNVSLHQCAALCDLHKNCSTVMYYNRICQFYGVDYVRSPYPIATFPALPWRAFYLKSGCQYLYSKYLNKCFTLLNNLTSKSAHAKDCNYLGGKLLQMNSSNEHSFLRELLNYKNGNTSMAYYVGAEVLYKSNLTFIWTNTSMSLYHSSMWASNQPDGGPGPNEDCVEITKQFDYMLNDVSCSMNKTAICEFPLSI